MLITIAKWKKNQKEIIKIVDGSHQILFIDCINLDLDTSKIKVVESIDFSFDLIVRISKLTKTSHYNTYQQKLYRLVKFLKEKRGIGYRRISHILTEKGYLIVRTNSVLKN